MILRIKYNISQEEMARLLKLKLDFYVKKEEGKQEFTFEEMLAISNFFQLEPEAIFSERHTVSIKNNYFPFLHFI